MVHVLIFHIQRYRKETYSVTPTYVVNDTTSTKFIPLIYPVEKECNMVVFAEQKIPNYDPDSGKGYYQLVGNTEVYISSKTKVVLISKVGQNNYIIIECIII